MYVLNLILCILLCQLRIVWPEGKWLEGEATPDYGFLAYLFSKRNTKIRCTGAIVAKSWILDYCEATKYKYNAVRVGPTEKLTNDNRKRFIYNIDKRIKYPGHVIFNFPEVNNDYNLSSLYASRHAIFLDHTDREMEWILGIIRPIALSRNPTLPKEAKTVFFPKAGNARFKMLPIIDKKICNNYYKKSYDYTLFENQFCVNSSKVTYDECCASHAVMESSNRLIGIVAWSTACWSPPEPWVFSNVGYYYNWIVNITSDDPIFP